MCLPAPDSWAWLENLTWSPVAGDQHVSGSVQVAVVDLRPDAQDVTHQRIDVDCLKGPHLQVLVESRAHRPEEGLHIHLRVVKAVLALVELYREILRGGRDNEQFVRIN